MGIRSLQNQQVKLSITATARNVLSTDPALQASAAINFSHNPELSSGVSEDQANRVIDYSATIAASGTLVIDLYDLGTLDMGAGAGLDLLGQAVIIEEIMLIMIKNKSAESGGVLQIAPDASNGWAPIGSHTVANGGALQPDGLLLKMQTDTVGFDVADASSHRIILTATGGDVDFRLVILGRHDDDESSSSSSSQSSSSQSSSSSSQSSSSSSA